MDIYSIIRERVTAKDAAMAYGVQIGRGGRAVCPWHKDHHPDLNFYANGTCYCFACHNGGDATALVAQLFGLQMKDAAEKINADFNLGIDGTTRIRRTGPSVQQLRKEREAKERKRWGELCETGRECEKKLRQYPMETAWDTPEFVMLLKVQQRANERLDIMWNKKEVGLE